MLLSGDTTMTQQQIEKKKKKKNENGFASLLALHFNSYETQKTKFETFHLGVHTTGWLKFLCLCSRSWFREAHETATKKVANTQRTTQFI